mmetsp:Transcript_13669/g.26792  ORF Transcript_13669/g.26792 Transcript_13669/m.26792 type:complete len:476 (+) Transcript_13669:75-1502(+)
MGVCPTCRPRCAFDAGDNGTLNGTTKKTLRNLYVASGEVDVKRKPNLSKWGTRKVYRFMYLRGFGEPQALVPPKRTLYGGWTEKKLGEATGFFRVTKIGKQYWLVDPTGHVFYMFGLSSVRRDRSSQGPERIKKKFGGSTKWASKTSQMLLDTGINCVGAWSDHELLNKTDKRLPYTKMLHLMEKFGKSIGYTRPGKGHVDFWGNCMPVFHESFRDFALKCAKDQIGAMRDDPWCIGFFTDNELPWRRDMLQCYLKLDEKDPGYVAATRWMHEKGYSVEQLADAKINMEFLSHVAERYFSICAEALHVAAPNHLNLGCRFHGQGKKHPEVHRVAGHHVDVISINWYDTWDPRTKRDWTDMWVETSGKPFLITEFYAKGMDTKLPNKGGAGWVVKTQEARGAFFESFALGLMEHPGCVGYHWFKYMDDHPAEKKSRVAISNKGLLSSQYEIYEDLHASQKMVNTHGYAILERMRRA